MTRQFKITDESNRYSNYFAVREQRNGAWLCIAWRETRIEAEIEAERLARLPR